MLSVLGIILFVGVMYLLALAFNLVLGWVGEQRGWFTKPLVTSHWYDKYFDRMNKWYQEKLEEQKQDGI